MTDRLSDEAVQHIAEWTSTPSNYPYQMARLLAVEVQELRAVLAGERLETYEHADGSEIGDCRWMDGPEVFEENEYDERTEVLHYTWVRVASESLWFGPESNIWDD